MPHLNLGMPFLADPGNSTLYPLNLLLLLPAPAGVTYLLVAHIVLGAFGAYYLLRIYKVTCWASVFGSISYSLGGFLLSMLSIPGYLPSICWMPLVAALGIKSARSKNLVDLVIFSLALGCQLLSGEVQGVMLTAMLLCALLLAEENNRIWSFARLGLASLISLALFMPQALPTIGYIAKTWRAHGIDQEAATAWSLHPLRLLELVVPGLLGNANRYDSYLGYFLYKEQGGLPLPWILSPYIGSVCIIFGVAGISSFHRSKHKRWSVAVIAISVVALLLSLGRFTPIFAVYYKLMPGAGFLRYPAKFFPLVSLGLSLLGAVGLDNCLSDKKRGDQIAMIAIVCGIALSVLILAGSLFSDRIGTSLAEVSYWVEVDKMTAQAIVRSALRLDGAILLVTVLVLYLAKQKNMTRLVKTAVALLLVQLFVSNRDIAPTVPPLYGETPPLAKKILNETPPGEPPRIFIPMSSEPPFWRCLEAFDSAHIILWSTKTLMMNEGILYGIGYPTAYSPISSSANTRFLSSTDDIWHMANNLLSVRHWILPKDSKVPNHIDLEVLEGFEHACIGAYRSTHAFPVARPVGTVLRAADFEESLKLIHRPEVLSGRSAAVEGIENVQVSTNSGSSPGVCKSERPTGNSFETTCELSSESWVVVNISHYDSWSASIDGAPVPIHRSNGLVMAVEMPAGKHHLELVYKEPMLPLGFLFTALGLAACVCLIVLHRRRPRRNSKL